VIFSNGSNWVASRRTAVRSLKDMGLSQNLIESLIADKTNELVANLRTMKASPVHTRQLFHMTALGGLWEVLTNEKLKPGRLSKVWSDMDKFFSKLWP